MINRIKYTWHLLNFRKNQAMLDGCLDESIRIKIIDRIQHHERSFIKYQTKLFTEK
jgi:hypothetical protein